uniref:CenpcA n=1 Tax=Arundo donax TaxID=35708 RepID=A0A0A9D7Z4_ARUDO
MHMRLILRIRIFLGYFQWMDGLICHFFPSLWLLLLFPFFELLFASSLWSGMVHFVGQLPVSESPKKARMFLFVILRTCKYGA